MLITIAGRVLRLDPSGALLWPERRLLMVADLHLEKAAALARAGRALLPPHDTAATLDRLEQLIATFAPRTVVSLGDGFHDRRAAQVLDGPLFDRLAALTRAAQWVWITGNHDPAIPLALGGAVLQRLDLDGLVLRHEPTGAPAEIAGHLHPKARLATRHGRLTRPCFVGDGSRLVMPAFGTLTGGLDVLDPAIGRLFPAGFTAWLTGERRIFAVPGRILPGGPRLEGAHRSSGPRSS